MRCPSAMIWDKPGGMFFSTGFPGWPRWNSLIAVSTRGSTSTVSGEIDNVPAWMWVSSIRLLI